MHFINAMGSRLLGLADASGNGQTPAVRTLSDLGTTPAGQRFVDAIRGAWQEDHFETRTVRIEDEDSTYRVRVLPVMWRKRGHQLGVGLGVAQGYATIGAIGFEGRWDYGAIGTVANLAARLCGEAKAGQILASTRVADAVEDIVESAPMEPLTLKGFHRPMPATDILRLRHPGP